MPAVDVPGLPPPVPGAPRVRPCGDWIDPEDLFGCGACGRIDEEDQNLDLAALATAAASQILYELSGRKYAGECSDAVRPCRRSTRADTPPWWTATWDRTWGACGCGSSTWRSCSCPALSEIGLGVYPLVAIDEILIDGDVLDPAAYQIFDHRSLARIDGENWPCCQDLAADPTTDDDTFQVTFTYGVDPPESGVLAARRLACELYLSCGGSDDCRLPKRVRSVARRGVDLAFLDPFDFLERGKTGVYEVDLFLTAVNPKGRRRAATILSPDVGPETRRQTWPT